MKKIEKNKTTLDSKSQYKPKIVAFVPARTTSSRLPEKHFKKIAGRTILEWIALRLRESGCIDQMVLCTPGNPSEHRMLEYGRSLGYTPFHYRHGNENDVVGRLSKAAFFSNAELCVLVSGDCPLICPKLLSQLVLSLCKEISINSKNNVASFESFVGQVHGLQGVKVATRGMWDLANLYASGQWNREHQFPLLDAQDSTIPGKSHIVLRGKAEDYHAEGMDLSVNTTAQLIEHRSWAEKLKIENLEYSYENIRNQILE